MARAIIRMLYEKVVPYTLKYETDTSRLSILKHKYYLLLVLIVKSHFQHEFYYFSMVMQTVGEPC